MACQLDLAQKMRIKGMNTFIRHVVQREVGEKLPDKQLPPLEIESAKLAAVFASNSPRVAGVDTPWSSIAIHASVLSVGFVSCMAAMWSDQGAMVWSIGLLLLSYDLFLQCLTLFNTWRLLKPSVSIHPGSDASNCNLGVIVAAHNEAAVLMATIKELTSQSCPPVQIMIADDGSTDGTADLLTGTYELVQPELGQCSQGRGEEAALYWLRLPHGGKARALNQAMLHMKADIVLTVDADTVLDEHALYAICQAFQMDPNLVAATGVLMPVDVTGKSTWLHWFQKYEYVRNFLSRYVWMRLNGLLLISGAFAAFRRQSVLEVGGFDDDCLVEDYELIHRLHRYSEQHGLKWTTAVVGQARAWTDAPGSVSAFLKQRRRWFAGFLQTQFWYRDMVGNSQYGAVGTRMLPIKAVDALQPLFGMTSLLILMGCLLQRRWGVVWFTASVIGMKTVIDMAFHAWGAVLYRRWTGASQEVHVSGAIMAALIEPWTFQLLRYTGALWGWFHFLTGRQQWDVSRAAETRKHGLSRSIVQMLPFLRENEMQNSDHEVMADAKQSQG